MTCLIVAVLAGGVHGLQDDQQRIGVLRVQPVLVLGQLLNAFGQQLLRFFLLDQIAGVAGIIVFLEVDLFGRVARACISIQILDTIVRDWPWRVSLEMRMLLL